MVIFMHMTRYLPGLVVEHFPNEKTVRIKYFIKQHYGKLFYTWPYPERFTEVPYASIRCIIEYPKLENKKAKRYRCPEMVNYTF